MARRGLPMVCANPDLVVESGDRLVPCAGAMAARYATFGGEAIIVGKPHAPIYAQARQEIDALAGTAIATGQILAIGDGAGTDMIGANKAGLPTLFVASGIHAAELAIDCDDGAAARVGAFLGRSGARADYFMPRLSW